VSTRRPKPPTNDRIDALPPAPTTDALRGPRADLARAIPRRLRVTWWIGIALAVGFAVVVTPAITAERWLASAGIGQVIKGEPAPLTVRVPPFAGYNTSMGHTGGGGVLIAKGERADRDSAVTSRELAHAQPHGATPYLAFLLLVGVLCGLFAHHTRRSNYGRLLRVQLVNLGLIVATAIVVKLVMLTTALSVLVVPVAVFAMVPTLVLDRVVGLATGTLAALVVAFLVPFDVGVAVMLMVQAGAAGLVIDERPKKRTRTIVVAGVTATACSALTYPLMLYLSAGRLPLGELAYPLHSAWLAAALGPALATALTLVFVPLYQLAVGEITQGKLVELEDLSHPLLRQIADKAPGTWQHSLTMANMAELAANAIGANGRLVRVGAYFHDLGKSLSPKYFIENHEPGETSPHDKLAPEVSCDAIFRHVTEGIVAARRAGLHERIIDFMHMHHGNGVLEYFWAKCREHGNPRQLTVEHFRYPGVPPQSRETAILSICDAVEAAARTLKKPESAAIDSLVQRIVYGKLHVGQLDESGLSMSDLRRITESLRDTIRHANHGRIEYPWQKSQQDASAHPASERLTSTAPRLDSLDRPARAETVSSATRATTVPSPDSPDASELAMLTTAPLAKGAAPSEATSSDANGVTPAATRRDPLDTPRQLRGPLPSDHDVTVPAPKQDLDADEAGDTDVVELRQAKSTSELVAQFADDAKRALDDAAKDAVKDAPATDDRGIRESYPVIEIVSTPSVTVPPPTTIRPPGINYLDDMITLRPQYEAKPVPEAAPEPPPEPAELVVTKEDDGSVLIEPAKAAPADDPGTTQPSLPSAWARGLAERLDAQIEHDFGAETRQQSLEEIERLHEQARERPSQDLDLTVRRHYATSEIEEADIEAAIELHPPARRSAVGVAKKKRDE